ncbi:MAG TPA: hypothetical protein VJS44_03850 [Pyrinomonadaceae bacterium]|nr:hypothetical protein [Pyrinomonadaceae bacterium]
MRQVEDERQIIARVICLSIFFARNLTGMDRIDRIKKREVFFVLYTLSIPV